MEISHQLENHFALSSSETLAIQAGIGPVAISAEILVTKS
jgi:hypothetical protein